MISGLENRCFFLPFPVKLHSLLSTLLTRLGNSRLDPMDRTVESPTWTVSSCHLAFGLLRKIA